MSKPHKRKTRLNGAPQQVRIIGGNWKGRLLPVTQKPGLRPTPNRIRETVFNWLQMHIEGSDCLDLFAGSGALGFEAASRGAAQITLIEKDAAIAQQLKQQVEVFKAKNISIQQADGLNFPQSTEKQFDLVFLDPPFNQIDLEELLAKLVISSSLKPSAKVYVEAPLGQLPKVLPDNWTWSRQAKASQVEYGLIATD